MKKIEIYDTTLRDGSQSEGISFSSTDKIKIIKLLDKLGADYIEAGWPGANPKDIETFSKIKELKLKNAKIAAFGCTKKPKIKPKDDEILNKLLEADTEIITIFGKTWSFHVTNALNTTLQENLNMIKESIEYLVKKGKTVFFDAEHFYDGYKNDPKYALKAVKAAYDAGAERIILCDTNGGCINNEIYNITKIVQEYLPEAKIGLHMHNDGEMAVANTIAGVDAGAIQVQGTINGYGERCGNANLCSIIPNLQLKKGYDCLGKNISKLTFISNSVAEISNVIPNSNTPFVGKSAFTHKAGIHASGVMKNSKTYEHINPSLVGNSRKILVSDQAGTSNIRHKLEQLNFVENVTSEDLQKIVKKMKKLEWEGFAYEGAEASFELLVMDILNRKPRYFDVLGFRVIGDTFDGRNEINTEASVKLDVNGQILHTVSEGDGPVNALDKAIRKALAPIYKEISKFRLNDCKVRILDSKSGTAAKVRVTIETTNGFDIWDTVGVSANVIEASYMAILDSVNYGLMVSSAKPISKKN